MNDSNLVVSWVSSYFSTGDLFSCELHTRDSFSGNFIADFYLGVDAVLGPANITKDDQIPVEQCINTCKLRPGSGCLGVKIFADGPTRVLQITDCLQQVRFKALCGYTAAIQLHFIFFSGDAFHVYGLCLCFSSCPLILVAFAGVIISVEI